MECILCHRELIDEAVFCPACNTQQPGKSECTEVVYSAFISYRHAPQDQRVAESVQKAIERYKLPRGVKRDWGNADSRKLERVFRDVDELPAAHSLPDKITEALQKAHSLVVICSPEMSKSIWVKREVETYASMHGRDRIFAVLANGDELSNIPDILKSKTVVGADGALRVIETEPLAADLRPESSNRASTEKLRILASVIGCEFDDLRQRNQSRRRKIAAGIAAAIVAVAFVLGMLGLQVHAERQRAQLTESYRLTIQSQHLLAQGDRYGAIESALAALPESNADNSVYAPEAKEALEAALQVHPTNAYWLSCYTLETESPIGNLIDGSFFDDGDTFESSTNGYTASDVIINYEKGWFAFAQKDGTMAIHDIRTGNEIIAFQIMVDGQPMAGFQSCILETAANTLIVGAYNFENIRFVAWDLNDEQSEEFKWAKEGRSSNVATSPWGNVAVTSFAENGVLTTWRMSVESGEIESKVVAEIGEDKDDIRPREIASTFGETSDDFYIAAGGVLVHETVDANEPENPEIAMVPLAYEHVCSIEYENGIVLVASRGDDANYLDIPYTIEAFDSSLNKKWEYTGTYSNRVLQQMDNDHLVLLYGEPTLWGPAYRDGSIVAASAGRTVMLFDTNTGEVLVEETESDTIVGLSPDPDNSPSVEGIVLVVSTADGTVMAMMPFNEGYVEVSRDYKVVLPERIRWAQACYIVDPEDPSISNLYVIALSADNESKVFVYRYALLDEFASAKTDREYSLDETRALAHETLAAAGRE